MPREGKAYDVDDVWRARVKERLTTLGKKPAWLAAESGCPRSMISELLSGKRNATTYLPEIHAALGWKPPGGPLDEVATVHGSERHEQALDPESETIRRNLVNARDRLGLDIHDVNSLSGIPLETLRAYELGAEQPSGIHLKQLAAVYRVTMNDLTEARLPPPDPAARQVIHMRTEPGALDLLTAEERGHLEKLRREIAAMNEAARKRQLAKGRKR